LGALNSEAYVTEQNMSENGLLRCALVVRYNTTDLTNVNQAQFFNINRFGDIAQSVGGVGGTTTLQQAYKNSVVPQIVIDSTSGPLAIQGVSGSDSSTVFEIMNTAGNVVASIDGLGNVSASHLIIDQITGSNATISSMTGSLLGTASYSLLSQTSSYVTLAQTASYVMSASYATTSSYVTTSQTASYVVLAQTASYVTLAQTASYVTSASYTTTSSYVVTSSYASIAGRVESLITNISSSVTLTNASAPIQNIFITSSINIQLPSTANGISFTLKKSDTGSYQANVIAYPNQLIDGYATQSLTAFGDALSIVPNKSSNYWIIV
jgi:hypothetical protein